MTSLTVNFPARADIANITNAPVALVFTVNPHGYQNYIQVTIVIPYPNVMEQINGKTYTALVFNPNVLILFEYFNSPTNFKFLDTSKIGPFAIAPLVQCTIPQPQPLPPAPPIPPTPPVTFFVPGQKAQLVPAGETTQTLLNASNVIGPNNPP